MLVHKKFSEQVIFIGKIKHPETKTFLSSQNKIMREGSVLKNFKILCFSLKIINKGIIIENPKKNFINKTESTQ